MNGQTELQKQLLKNKIEMKQTYFDNNKKYGLTDWVTLNEINELKKELESLDNTCNLDDDCLNCGS